MNDQLIDRECVVCAYQWYENHSGTNCPACADVKSKEILLPAMTEDGESIWAARDRHRELLKASLLRERKVIESRTKMVRDISLKWSAAESRVAALEGLLRRWVATGAPVGTFGDVVFADTVTALAPAPLTEGE